MGFTRVGRSGGDDYNGCSGHDGIGAVAWPECAARVERTYRHRRYPGVSIAAIDMAETGASGVGSGAVVGLRKSDDPSCRHRQGRHPFSAGRSVASLRVRGDGVDRVARLVEVWSLWGVAGFRSIWRFRFGSGVDWDRGRGLGRGRGGE